MASSRFSLMKPQNFEFYLVLDFEATCEYNKQIVPQEIIEVPVLKLNSRTLEIESVFHRYVQPKVNKQLTSFCTSLTGINQEDVNEQPHLEEVLEELDCWYIDNWLHKKSAAFVTCGDWDLKKMLPGQCAYFSIPCKPYFNQWINIKLVFQQVMGYFPRSMMEMLRALNICHEGRHHSGIDDSKNICNILSRLLQLGAVPQITGWREY